MAIGRPARHEDLDAGSFGAAEVAAMLGVTRQAVQARARRGTLRAFKGDNGAWRIPAEVAKALVSAEHHRGLSAGTVRALPAAAVGPEEGGESGSAVLTVLEARLSAYEVRMAEQDRRMEELLARQRDELAAKEAELIAAKVDAERFRQALLALAGPADPPKSRAHS